MIEIIKAGQYNSIQDYGRFGYRHLGIPYSGVMDRRLATLANQIAGNPSDYALLELSVLPPVLKFRSALFFAIVAPHLSSLLNGSPVQSGQLIHATNGDILSLRSSNKSGLWGYLAVSGGFAIDPILSSCSTYSLANIGHKELASGDLLLTNDMPSTRSTHSRLRIDELLTQNSKISAYPGPEYQWLDNNAQSKIFSSSFHLSSSFNRMAYPLIGPSFAPTIKQEMLSSAVLPGTVQLLPNGQLVILMRDCQTSGGYPRVLQIKEEDLNTLSQMKPKKSFTFHQA